MQRNKFVKIMCLLALAAFWLSCGADQAFAQNVKSGDPNSLLERIKRQREQRVTNEERKAAAERLAKARKALADKGITASVVTPQGGVPDYVGIANWANSPVIRKFVDTLPGLTAANANNVDQDPIAAGTQGQYISVANADKLTYPGSDYYEIELREYTGKFHSDLPPTRLRGYVQANNGTDPAYVGTDPLVGNTIAPAPIRYLGPTIVAQKDRPVRIKFTNKLPLGMGGDLFIPVDTTVMGSGMGPYMAMATGAAVVSGNTVQITTMAPHNLKADERIMLNGFLPAEYNGMFMVLATGLTPTTFQVTLASPPSGPVTQFGHVEENFPQNRATLHLHGGRSPWISDGTPHQWTTPAGEITQYPEGVSVSNVPDMPDPGDGSLTFFYSNQQSARLLFYHDHAWGITRLNVYAGEAAGYLITSPTEEDLITRSILPTLPGIYRYGIPLIIQDKSFVDTTTPAGDPTDPNTLDTDPTWNWGTGVPNASGIRPLVAGDLWYPHVYVPAQNPYDIGGANAYGRWHYGPWFFPTTTGIEFPPVPNPYCLPTPPAPGSYPNGTFDNSADPLQPPYMPGTPNPSIPGESFFDIVMVNGAAYPTVSVEPKAYRFRILNAANDRFFNLSMYVADPAVVSTDGRANTEIKMVPAAPTVGFPDTWPTDGRVSGVPDPATRGPSWIQIGTEGGFLPAPVVIPPQPIVWNLVPTTFDFGNVYDHSLLLGGAERADVIVDFGATDPVTGTPLYAGKTLIVYNDAPAAFPALDDRYDYYAGAPDLRSTGGYGIDIGGVPSGPQPGFSPNTRTVMQIVVAAGPIVAPFDNPDPLIADGMAALQAEFASTAGTPGVFARSQPPIIVAQKEYNSAYGKSGVGTDTFPTAWPLWGYARIQDWSMQFQNTAGTNLSLDFKSKAIHDEMGAAFDEYGRMSGKLGLQMPNVGPFVQNFNLQTYVDPVTEIITASPVEGVPVAGDGTQIWRITHNGVDTHPIHFHLFDVQLLNRVGWDGAIRLPNENELGWKETIRISPLEDTIVALRPVAPKQTFGLPDSLRPLNPAVPIGSMMGFSQLDPYTGNAMNPPVTNQIVNFGQEYVWHCHLLSHEEMDMMRPVKFDAPRALPVSPSTLTVNYATGAATLQWTDGTPASDLATMGNPANEVGFRIERAVNGAAWVILKTVPANPNPVSCIDTPVNPGTTWYQYRVVAFNAAGESVSNTVQLGTPPVTAPSNLRATVQNGPRVRLTWTDNATNETGFAIERDSGSGFVVLANVGPRNNTGSVTYTDSAVIAGGTYTYRVKAVMNAVASAYSNTATVSIPAPPAAPTNVAVSAFQVNNTNDRATVTWTDSSANENGFRIRWSRDVNFATGVSSSTVNANVQTFTTGNLRRGADYYFQVQAFNNVSGASAWVNATPYPVPTP